MENILSKLHEWLRLPYKLHTETKGNGPVIIFLHGIATSSASWDNLVPYLKADYKCVTIDLLGFGKSPKPEWYDYTPQEHINNIQYTIKKLKIRHPFILVGHSMGSLLALHYANEHPEKVARLIMLSPPIYLTKDEARKARKVWKDTLFARAYKYIRMHKNFTLKGARGIRMLALKNNPFHITEDTWISFSKSLENTIEKQSVVKDLEQIFCPVDIFYGTRDNLLIRQNIRKVASHTNVNIHPVRGGHFVSVNYARSVAELIAQG